LFFKKSLNWLFTNEGINYYAKFALFIIKSRIIFSNLSSRLSGRKKKNFNQLKILSNPIIIRTKHGFKAKIYDWFQYSMFTQDYEVNAVSMLKLNTDSTFVDVGANYGFYTLFTASKCLKGKVISIEANKKLFNEVKENVVINDFKNVECLNYAIWDKSGEEIKLYEDLTSGRNPTCFGIGENYSIIETITLDKIVSDFSLSKINWLKMDIESAEVKALEGSKNALKIIENLLLEIHSKRNGEECEQLLKNYGFDIRIISKESEDYYTILATKN